VSALLLCAVMSMGAARADASVVQGTWPGAAGPKAAEAYFGYPYPNAPACTDRGACDLDAWDFYQGQCTSWVAYRLNELNGVAFNDHYGGQHWGNATDWDTAASALGIPVNGTPGVGSVAWYAGRSGDEEGHVAYVEEVISSTEVVISEMNYDFDNGFRVRTITTTSGWPTAFIHIKDRTVKKEEPPPPPPRTEANLLTDGGFEADDNAWGVGPDVEGGVVGLANYENASLAHDGTHYEEANASSPGGSIYQNVAVNMVSGQSVTFSMWVRVAPGSSAAGQTANLCLWTLAGKNNNACQFHAVTHEWQQLQATATVTEPTSTLKAQVYYSPGANIDFDGGVLGAPQTSESPPLPPPTVDLSEPESVSPASERLTGVVDPEREPASECQFEYGATEALGSSVPCSSLPREGEEAAAMSAVVRELKPDTTYYYKLIAVGPGGTGQSSVATFYTESLSAPELGRCVKATGTKAGNKTVYHGGFANSTCTKASPAKSGAYEWEPEVVRTGFSLSLSKGPLILETTSKVAMRCTDASGGGSYKGTRRLEDIALRLSNCEQAGEKCTSPGLEEGDIAASTLDGVIGWASKAKKRLALTLTAQTAPALEYACGTSKRTVTGTVLVPLTADKAATTSALVFSESKGKQKPETLEGAAKGILESSLDGGKKEQAGLAGTLTLTSEEPIETNATI
jgi:surface antigen